MRTYGSREDKKKNMKIILIIWLVIVCIGIILLVVNIPSVIGNTINNTINNNLDNPNLIPPENVEPTGPKIVINHVYDDRAETYLDTQVVYNQEIGTEYIAKPRENLNYTNDGDKTITVKEGENIVTINYVRKLATVVVNHVYEGKEKQDEDVEKIEKVPVGSKYIAVVRKEKYYTAENNKEIYVKEGENAIIINYKRNPATVIINHIYEDREETDKDTEKIEKQKVGEKYLAKARKEDNYTSDGDKEILIKDGENIVTINYTRKNATVTVKHVYNDKASTSSDIEKVEKQKVGEKYLAKARKESNYTSDGDKEILVKDGENQVIINYIRKLSSVTINHVYEDKETVKETIPNLKLGSIYTANAKTDSNYTSDGNKSITITEITNQVTINYVRKNLYYYDSLNMAVADANTLVTDNHNKNLTYKTATAKIEKNASTGNFTVSPVKDINLTETLNVSGTYTLDLSGKQITATNLKLLIEIAAGANLTLKDSVGGGKISSYINSNYNSGMPLIITSGYSSNLHIINGVYELMSDSTIAGGINARGNLVLDNPKVHMNVNSSSTLVTSTMLSCASSNALVTINGGDYKAYTNRGIVILSINNTKTVINGGNFLASSSSKTPEEKIYVLNALTMLPITINGGNFKADVGPLPARYTDIGVAAYIDIMGNSVCTINNGTFTGIHSGALLNGSGTYRINGGLFRSVTHGGIYFSAKNTYIKNATLTYIDYDGDYTYNPNDFSNNQASFYIGNPQREVTVYMDNCTIERGTSVLSSNYNYKNTYLYVSNTKFNSVRVDGPRSTGGGMGHFYVGKGTTYKGIFSPVSENGIIDTTTYEDTEFCQ